MDVLHWLYNNHQLSVEGVSSGIIPTVLIPLTALTVGLSSIAAMIAGWFGLKLHTEGPRQLLEVLLKKRVLFSMLVLNILSWGGYQGYIYFKTLPKFLSTIKSYSENNQIPSSQRYNDSLYRPYRFEGFVPKIKNISLETITERKLPRGSFRSGVISGNSIFFGSDDGFIYELDKKDLSTTRKFYIGTQVTTRPIIFNNKLYAGEGNHDTHHARIYSFDLKSGEFLSAYETKGHTEGQPVIVQHNGFDIMLIPAGKDGLHAINPNTMKPIWHKKDGHLDATVSIENGVVYAGFGIEKGNSKERSFAIAYDLITGSEIWKKQLPLSNWMHPVITKFDVCYVLGEIYIPSNVGLFYCLNKTNGAPHFSIPSEAPIASKPVYLKINEAEYAYYGNLKGEVCGVSINTKEKIWCKATSEKSRGSALSSLDYDPKTGLLWYPSLNNGLFAIDPLSGQDKTHWRPSLNQLPWENNFASVSLENNKIYQMDIKGNLRLMQYTAN